MTIRARKFSPEILLSVPRRSAGIPNADGSQVLYTTSTHSFESGSTQSGVHILDGLNQTTKLVTKTKGASEPTWLEDGNILLLIPGDEGKTKIVVGDPQSWDKSATEAGVVDGPASSVKLVHLGKDDYAFAISAQVTPEGNVHNPETAPKSKTSGRLYTTTFVRHWDSWITPNKNSIWIGKLTKKDSKYSLSKLTNALKGSDLESPVPPFGGSDNYDISANGLTFVAKDLDVNFATNTKVNWYVIPITDFSSQKVAAPVQIQTHGLDGLATSPVFSPDGKKAALVKMRQNGYEADKNQLLVIPDTSRPNWVVHVFATPDNIGRWDRSPQSLSWSSDSKTLYITAEDIGRSSLYVLPTHDLVNVEPPSPLKTIGSITDVRPLSNGKVFLSGSSLIDNSTYFIFDPQHDRLTIKPISSHSHNGAAFGLFPGQVDEYWWPGAGENTKIHAWVVKPSTFDPKEKYPLAYVIHGGPQSAWMDSWSYRWNPAILAEQGYVVVCPNPTGSTGYGQALTDAIQGQWGGLPYQDLVLGFEHIEKNIPYVDTSRAVALGASYGGFMMNWIQGQPLGRKFRAIVCHDGVFSMAGQMASEELWFPFHDLEGRPWENPEGWLRWDPSRFTKNWDTPQLVIHSDLDYRLTIAEGLAAFNVLQARGIKSQFLTFPDENHWVLKPENSLLWHKTVLDFINDHVSLPKYSATIKTKGISPNNDEGVQDVTKRTQDVKLYGDPGEKRHLSE